MSYLENYSVYAERYGNSERTVKRWVRIGRDKADECPLDDPSAFVGWWSRHMKNRVPAAVLCEASKGAAPPLLELPVQPPAPIPIDPPPLERRELGVLAEEDRGIQIELRRAEERAYHAHQAWVAAMEANDEDRAAFANRQCQIAAESVRKIQKDATDDEIRLKNYIPRLEAERLAVEFHTELVSRLRGMAEGMARTLGLAVTAELEARWEAEIDLLCESLQAEIFRLEEAA